MLILEILEMNNLSSFLWLLITNKFRIFPTLAIFQPYKLEKVSSCRSDDLFSISLEKIPYKTPLFYHSFRPLLTFLREQYYMTNYLFYSDV